MINAKQQRVFLVIGLVLSVMIIFLPVMYTRYYHELTGAPLAVNGTLHVSSKFMDRENHRIYLDGQWAFYWKQLLVTEPEPQGQPDLILNVPDKWSKYQVDGHNLPTAGYGSYKLTLTGLAYEVKCTRLSRHISGINKLIAPFIIMLFDAVIVDDSIQLVLDSPRTDEVGCNCRRSCSC